MKCETIRNMFSSYIDKDLNDIEKTELENHLAECNECRKEYENLLDIISVCNNLEEVELPQDFRTELHQRLIEEKKKKSFFGGILERKGMKMATGLVAAALVIAIGIGNSSLFTDNNMKMAQDSGSAPGYGATEFAAPSSEPFADSAVRNEEESNYKAAEAEQPQIALTKEAAPKLKNSMAGGSDENLLADKGAAIQPIESSRSGRMVIRTANLSVNVENVEKATTDIRQLTESSGGYVENSHIETIPVNPVIGTDGGDAVKEAEEKYANLTVRVPEDKFENTFNNIKAMGKLVSENMSGSDITAEYRDTSARVDNLKIQEQSLQQLMTKAKNVDEILRIEQELNRVRTDIDINSGNLKRWDNLVQLSTINIYMKELKAEELKSVDVSGMWGKAYKGFISALNNIVTGLENFFVVLVTAIPYLAVVGALAAIGLLVARKVRKKKQ